MHGPSRLALLSGLLALAAAAAPARAARPEPSVASERPDPATVQRYGPAYRYPRAGWIVLHIEGAPYDRGYQHGRLLAAEIADYVKTLATKRSPAAPGDAWRETRTTANALFLRRYDPEYLEEMKGIADGASAAGARFLGRPLDLLDIVTVNSDIEMEFLDSALDATPTGLEGKTFREPADLPATPAPPEHCSAFAATGPATADGKVVIGHITMFSLAFVRHFNVWLDVKPEKGHRVLMQTYPGGIQSGMDYYMNDAGLVVAETTVKQTRFDINGKALASRIRKALQYADSIDGAVATLKEGNNGMYTNEWLLADTKTDEIAMFELGTHRSKLWRSGNDEWFGGTKGFYWGCNNAKDLEVRLETVPGVAGRPANLVFHPSDRDRTWLRLYEKHKGKIGEAFGFEAFTTPPLAAFPSCDAKFTTSAMAKDLRTWALFGNPTGRTWEPSDAERKKLPDVPPLVSNDWTVLTAEPPAPAEPPRAVAGAPRRADDLADDLRGLKAVREGQRTVLKLSRDNVRLMTELASEDAPKTPEEDESAESYRRWSERLRDVATAKAAAAGRLDRSGVGKPATPADRLSEGLAGASRRLQTIQRMVRSRNDPAVVNASARVEEFKKKLDEAKKAEEPAPAGDLKGAGDEIAALAAQEEAIKDRLARFPDRERSLGKTKLALHLARANVATAEASLRDTDARIERLEGRARAASPAGDGRTPRAVDLPGVVKDEKDTDDDPATPHPAAWHGTILPKTDADTWLAAAFADHEKIVARELALKARAKGRELRKAENDALAVAMFAPYSHYRTAVARLGKDVPLSQTRAELASDEWYQIASGKGVLLLAALRERVGDEAFLKLMDSFGRGHAGTPVSADAFRAEAVKASGDGLGKFFDEWTTKTGLPGTGNPSGGFWSVDSYEAEPESTVIVYGTLKESDAQREAAGRLQRQIQRRWSNVTVPVVADRDATADALKGRHVLLVGRPDTNSAAPALTRSLPLTFGPASFVLRGETYANPQTAVVAAGPNPADPRHEVVVFAGLGAEATWRCVQIAGDRDAAPAEVVVLPAGRKPRRVVAGER